MSVEFRKVSYTYPGSSSGVFDIDLTIESGELLAVIGASGSGKTTLLKLLAGFLFPDSGRILIDGREVTHLPPRARELGVVFQSYALFQHMSAWRNVAYPLKIRKIPADERRAMAFAALAKVNLAGFEERLPATLSGGQQQRVALARALVFNPKALLLDEPLSALDAALRTSMRDEILRVQQQADIATLHVTHDQEEALSIASRVAVMEGGRLIQVAPPRELYDAPANARVAAFVGQANLWQGRVAAPGRVDCVLGQLACDTDGFAPGDTVTVLVRPERIQPVGPALPAARSANLFAGRIERDRFLGPVRRFDLVAPGGLIQGETTFWGGVEAVSIPPESIRLLPASTTQDLKGEPR